MKNNTRMLVLPVFLSLALCGCGDKASSMAQGFARDNCSETGANAFPGNHLPTTPVTRLAPTVVSPFEPLRCVVDAWSTDEDGDQVSYRFSWLKDGQPTQHAEMIIHDFDTTDGETWTCVVTPFDGKEEGAPGVAAVTVGLDHPLPTAPRIAILPEQPVPDDDLRCVVEEASVDLHGGEAVTYLFEWLRDMQFFVADVSEINSEDTNEGEQWTCVVIPRGLQDDGPRVTTSVVIGAAGSR